MEDNSQRKTKFIPMLSQIQEAASQLDDPEKATENTFEATIANSDKKIVFERISVTKSDGSKSYKWTYKGRLFINSRYQTRK